MSAAVAKLAPGTRGGGAMSADKLRKLGGIIASPSPQSLYREFLSQTSRWQWRMLEAHQRPRWNPGRRACC